MDSLETNDWMILNSIIYKIHTNNDFDDMRKELLEKLKMVFDFDSADFFLAAEDGSDRLVDPVYYNSNEKKLAMLDELDYSRGLMYNAESSRVYRETDIISDTKRVQSEYYKLVYEPNNWHYSLQLILGHNGKFLGVVTFYRLKEKENFEYDDVFLLDMLKEHLAYRIYQYQQEKQNHSEEPGAEERITVREAIELYGLTNREGTILKALMDGMDNQALSEQFTISPNTVKKHILNIYRKLDISNRVQLFMMVKDI